MFQRRPPTDLDHLHDHIERIWERLTQGATPAPGFCPPGFDPPTDVLQTEDEIVVLIEVAGLRGSELDFELIGDRLTIRGTKLEPKRPAGARYAQMEIVGGPFERSVTLPGLVSPQAAAVEYANGYLQIRMPRARRAEEQRVRIPVRRI